jgi:Flp pilus assembly protein TadG
VSKGLSFDRGAAAVEMAIASMFLLVLVLGIVDLGRAITTNISVRDAVQEGAMYGAFTRDVTTAEIDARVKASVSEPDLTTASITVYCEADPRDLQDGTRVRVEMIYDVDLITPIVGPALGGTITLEPTAEADRFYDTCPAGAVPMPTP